MSNISQDSTILTGCILVENWADSGGAVFNGYSDALTLASSILWGNDDSGGADESAQIHIDSSVASINNCCIEGWTGQLGGTGNIADDPEFVDADSPDGGFYNAGCEAFDFEYDLDVDLHDFAVFQAVFTPRR